MADDEWGAGVDKRGSGVETEPMLRRDLAGFLGIVAGFAAIGCASGDEQGVDDANIGRVMQAQMGATSVLWLDTVKGDLLGKPYSTFNGAVVVIVKGYGAVDDGGGGVYYWDGSSTQVHNVGVYVNPNPAAPSSSGRWVRIYSGPVNVRWFGATDGGDCWPELKRAVDYCVSTSRPLFWPAGTYKLVDPSGGGIPVLTGLHQVKHSGAGRVLRNGNYFKLSPQIYTEDSYDTNVLFVAKNGSATNDGLCSQYPLPLQAALDALHNYGPVLDGDWRIQLAAGTYGSGDGLPDPGPVNRTPEYIARHTAPSRKRVWIMGPKLADTVEPAPRPVPTCILQSHAPTAAILLVSGVGVQAYVQDILFQGEPGTPETNPNKLGTGIAGECGAALATENVHANDCGWAGIVAFETAYVRINHGKFWYCRMGVEMNATSGTVSKATLKLCSEAGIHWSRGAQGHIDDCVFDANAIGVHLSRNSRAHMLGNKFLGTAGMTAHLVSDTGAVFYENPGDTNPASANTYDSSAIKWLNKSYSGEDGMLSEASTEQRCACVGRYAAIGSSTTFPVAYTVPANWFRDRSKKLRVRVIGHLPADANAKVGVVFGGSQTLLLGLGAAPPAGQPFSYECELWPDDFPGLTQRFAATLLWDRSPRIDNRSLALNTAAALSIQVRAELTSGSLEIHRVEVWRTG